MKTEISAIANIIKETPCGLCQKNADSDTCPNPTHAPRCNRSYQKEAKDLLEQYILPERALLLHFLANYANCPLETLLQQRNMHSFKVPHLLPTDCKLKSCGMAEKKAAKCWEYFLEQWHLGITNSAILEDAKKVSTKRNSNCF